MTPPKSGGSPDLPSCPGTSGRHLETLRLAGPLWTHLLYPVVERCDNGRLEHPHPPRSLPGPVGSTGVWSQQTEGCERGEGSQARAELGRLGLSFPPRGT